MGQQNAPGDVGPAQLAAQWLRVRRRFELQASRSLGPAQREALRIATLDQLAVLGRMPLGPLPADHAEERLGMAGEQLDAVLTGMRAAGLLEQRTSARGDHELVLSDRGRRVRNALDELQTASLAPMFEVLGPELSSRLMQVVESTIPG